jgi:O-antigen ligase
MPSKQILPVLINAQYYTLILLFLLIPWSLAGMQIALALFSVMTIGVLFFRRKKPHLNFLFFKLLAVYLAARLISALFAPEPFSSFKAILDTEWVIFTIPLLFSIDFSEKKQRIALQTLIFSAALVGIYGCIQFFYGLEYFRGQQLTPMGGFYRASGGYNHYLTLAGNQLMLLGIGVAFFLLEGKWNRLKTLYFIAAMIIFLSVIATFGRSAWLALMVLMGLTVLLTKTRLFGYVFGVMLLAAVVASLISPEVQARFISIFDISQNQDRFNLWHTALNMIKNNPIWGVGQGNFTRVFPLYEVPGFYDSKVHAHNDYLNAAANSGMPSALAWLALWISWFYVSLKTYLRKNLSLFERQVLLGSILALSGILFAALFQCYYTDLENNLLWWTLASLGLKVALDHSRLN